MAARTSAEGRGAFLRNAGPTDRHASSRHGRAVDARSPCHAMLSGGASNASEKPACRVGRDPRISHRACCPQPDKIQSGECHGNADEKQCEEQSHGSSSLKSRSGPEPSGPGVTHPSSDNRRAVTAVRAVPRTLCPPAGKRRCVAPKGSFAAAPRAMSPDAPLRSFACTTEAAAGLGRIQRQHDAGLFRAE